ncbi:MAG: hypothetical protein JO265_10395 [Acidimicrobiia bacterium]|nr:hypothetical protein [Acidimicrobiia bacterium]
MFKRVAVSAVAVGAAAVVWGAAASGATGSQRFSISGSNRGGAVYAAGPISGSGRDVVLGPNQDRFVFASGSVLVDHQPSSQTSTVDPRSCLGRFGESGNYQIVSGTGAYQGATGSGTYTVRGISRGCSAQASTRYFVTASGWTTLP